MCAWTDRAAGLGAELSLSLRRRKPGISVLLAAQDEQFLIGLSIRSFLELGDEVIVVDNGSQDATRQIARTLAERYPDRVRFFANGAHCAGAGQLLNVLEHNPALIALCEELNLPILARRPGFSARVGSYLRRRPLMLTGVLSVLMLGIFIPAMVAMVLRHQREIDDMQQQVRALQMTQELVAQPGAFRGTLDEARDVRHHKAALRPGADHSEVRV